MTYCTSLESPASCLVSNERKKRQSRRRKRLTTRSPSMASTFVTCTGRRSQTRYRVRWYPWERKPIRRTQRRARFPNTVWSWIRAHGGTMWSSSRSRKQTYHQRWKKHAQMGHRSPPILTLLVITLLRRNHRASDTGSSNHYRRRTSLLITRTWVTTWLCRETNESRLRKMLVASGQIWATITIWRAYRLKVLTAQNSFQSRIDSEVLVTTGCVSCSMTQRSVKVTACTKFASVQIN